MKILKAFLIGTSTICILSIGAYLGVLYGIPKIVNSKTFSTNLESFISKKTGLNTEIKGLKISISPKFITFVNCNKFSILDNKKSALEINKIQTSIDLKSIIIKNINVNSAFIDIKALQNSLSKNQKKS